jgi:hypothetical protein
MGCETIIVSDLEEIQSIVQLGGGNQSVMIFADNAILRTMQVSYEGNHHN